MTDTAKYRNFNLRCVGGPSTGDTSFYSHDLPVRASQVQRYYSIVCGGVWVATPATNESKASYD